MNKGMGYPSRLGAVLLLSGIKGYVCTTWVAGVEKWQGRVEPRTGYHYTSWTEARGTHAYALRDLLRLMEKRLEGVRREKQIDRELRIR